MRLCRMLLLYTILLLLSQGICRGGTVNEAELRKEYSTIYTYVFAGGQGFSFQEAKSQAIINAARRLLLEGGYAAGKDFNVKKRDHVLRLTEDLLTNQKSDLIKGAEIIDSESEVHDDRYKGSYKWNVTLRALKGRAPNTLELWNQEKKGSGRWDGVWHSAIFPGWGQFRFNRNTEGVLFLTGALGSGGTAYAFNYTHKHPRLKMHLFRAAVGIYAVNILDALFFCTRDRTVEVILSPVEAKLQVAF